VITTRSRSVTRRIRGAFAAFSSTIFLAWVQGADAAELGISVDVRDVVNDYSWGYETGLKQHLGSYKNQRSVHAISRFTRMNPTAGLPPLGSADFLVWVDEGTGETAAVEHPVSIFAEGVNPGGNVTFGADEPAEEEGRLWWVLSGRANELAFDLARSVGKFDPQKFDVIADDFETTGRSTAPTLSVVGRHGLLAYRYLHSTDPNGAVIFSRFYLDSVPPFAETTKQLGKSSAGDLGTVTTEQVWSRWDPRRRALAVTWHWFARDRSVDPIKKYFGSNPFVYSDDLGETWRLADGSPVTLPLSYVSADPKTSPYDHLALRQSTDWYPRDIGFAPDDTPWLVLPAGGPSNINFFFWGQQGWESRALTSDLDKGDPIGCGTTRDFVVCAFSESQKPGQLLLRHSADSGRSWSAPVTVDTIGRTPSGSVQRIDWVSFVQPADGYPDNAARFFVGYFNTADGSFGRRFKNRIRWVRLEIGGPNSDPAISITSPVEGANYASGTAIDLSSEKSDPDGDAVSVVWTANDNPIAVPWTPVVGAYRVVAQASDGKGGVATDTVSIAVASVSVPDAPIMNPPAVAGPTVTLSWSNVRDETGYDIGRWNFATSTQTCKGLVIFKTTAADITTAKNTIRKGGKFCYAVRAFNDRGVSSWSNIVQVTLTP